MENLSDDDFRSYMTDFQSYLHNIGDLGPIESPSTAVHEADTEAGEAGPVSASSSSPPPSAAASASESSINWSAMNNEEEHRATTTTTMMTTTTTTTGMEMDEERSIIAEEDDEDRIVAEGCDLDCVTKDPDLIPSQKHSVWFPDVTRDEDDEVLRGPEVVGEDLMTGSEEDSGYSQVRSEEEKTKEEEPLNIEGEEGEEGGKGEWQNEVDTDLRRPDVEGSAAKEDREEDDGRGGGCDEDQPMSSSSSAIDGNVSWRYFGDDRIHSETEKEEEVEEDKEEVRGPEVATEDDDLKKVIEVEECSPREEKNERTKKDDDEILVDFGEVKAIVVDVPPLSSQGFRDEVSNEGEEKMGEETEEENRHGKAAAASVDAESCEEQSLVTFDATTAGDEIMNGSHSANHVNTESSHVVADKPGGVPSAPTTFEASDLVLEEELDEEEKAFVKEQEAKYWEEHARLMTSSADEKNKNTLIGHEEEEEVTESSSDVKPAQNGGGSAQLKIYPSQVRKTNNFLSEESQKRQDIDASRASNDDDILSPEGENENEEEEKDLPEQGSVKSLLAQWRQMEQAKKQQQQSTDAKDDHEHHQHQQHQRPRRPITAGWSQATPEDDDEIQPTRSRVRDEILRMRSQSCDPMSDRKTNRLSPNDDDVPSVGRRVGRGRSRMGDDGEGEGGEGDEGAEQSAEHYRSQPSLTKAILAKFENLDLQAASSAIKPKSNKNFKWQVKETTRFCRPGFVPRSGR